MKKIILFALLYFVPSPEFAQKPDNDILKQFDFYRSQYTRLRNEGKTDSVFFIARQCFQLAQTAKNDSLLQSGYLLLGNAFLIGNDFAPALEYYFKALSLADERQNLLGIGNISSNISFTYYQLGNYHSGVEYGRRGVNNLLAFASSTGENSSSDSYYGNLSNAYDNAGVCFFGLNEADSALKYLQSGFEVVLKSKDPSHLFIKAALLTDLGRTYELLKEDKMAESYFQQSFFLCDSLRMLSSIAYNVKSYGKFLLRSSRLNEVKLYGRVGMSAAIQSQAKTAVIDIARLLQEAFERSGDKDSAFLFAKMVNNYRDTVFSAQNMVAVQNAVFKRQLDEQDKQLKKQKEEKDRKHNLQYAAVALAVIAFVIFFILISHSIIANQRLIKFLGILALLIVFEFINLFIHPYLDKLTNHSIPLMLGIMVCIAALLIPLHHKLEHWITHKMIEKNNKIRLAAARKTIEQLERSKDAQQQL